MLVQVVTKTEPINRTMLLTNIVQTQGEMYVRVRVLGSDSGLRKLLCIGVISCLELKVQEYNIVMEFFYLILKETLPVYPT